MFYVPGRTAPLPEAGEKLFPYIDPFDSVLERMEPGIKYAEVVLLDGKLPLLHMQRTSLIHSPGLIWSVFLSRVGIPEYLWVREELQGQRQQVWPRSARSLEDGREQRSRWHPQDEGDCRGAGNHVLQSSEEGGSRLWQGRGCTRTDERNSITCVLLAGKQPFVREAFATLAAQ